MTILETLKNKLLQVEEFIFGSSEPKCDSYALELSRVYNQVSFLYSIASNRHRVSREWNSLEIRYKNTYAKVFSLGCSKIGIDLANKVEKLSEDLQVFRNSLIIPFQWKGQVPYYIKGQ